MQMHKRFAAATTDGEHAVIDIGSNTVRLVVYGGPPRAPAALHNEKVTAKLGRGVAESGLLSEKSMASALAGLRRFALLLKLRGVKQVDTVATAAVRDATNGQVFLERVRALGLSPRLLSGEEEAIASAHGVEAAFPGARGVVADLGGGSLELVHVDGQDCRHGVSLPLGSLRLPALRESAPAGFSRKVRTMVRCTDWHCAPGEALYLVGGSLRAFARFAVWQAGTAIDDPHAFELTAPEALALCRKLARSKMPPMVPGMSLSRLASLPHTAALLAALVREIAPARLVFSSWGLREGILLQSLDPASRQRDPLPDGIAAFITDMGISREAAEGVSRWTAGVCRADGNREERLRQCVAMLALAAQTVEPNLRAETAADWALRKRWIGLDAHGRAALASALVANAGRPLPEIASALPGRADLLARAQVWGLAVRLCRRFTMAEPQALTGSALNIRQGKLVLAITPPFDALYTEPAGKDLRILADRLGLEPSLEIASPL